MSLPPQSFVARQHAAFVAAGDKLFIFGGIDANGDALNDGALYDPARDSWTLVANGENTPSPRQMASATWTGLRVFVIGGKNADSTVAFADGGRYDPAANEWMPLPDLPVARVAPYVANVSSAGFVMTWGGYSASGSSLSGGERFSYNGEAWSPFAVGPGTPMRTSELAWASGDNGALLFGGRVEGNATGMGFLFNPDSGQWMGLSWNGPSPRYGAFSAWDGASFYVWGGRDEEQVLQNGYTFDRDGWAPMGGASPLGARYALNRRTGFAFANGTEDILFLGGLDESGRPLTDGARYRASAGGWSSIPAWISKENHEYGVFSLVNGELIVWGGKNGDVLTVTGERYRP
jgi:N-acetylneuraminic acid mutarotase